MNPADIFKFLPYAERMAKAAATIERLEKDPDVQDVIKLVGELGALIAQEQKPLQTG
jgi:UDP-N-acetylglucosamine enolpyruvyl transferase